MDSSQPGEPLKDRLLGVALESGYRRVTVWLLKRFRPVSTKRTNPSRLADHEVSQVSFRVELQRMKVTGDAQVLPMGDFFKKGLGTFKLGVR